MRSKRRTGKRALPGAVLLAAVLTAQAQEPAAVLLTTDSLHPVSGTKFTSIAAALAAVPQESSATISVPAGYHETRVTSLNVSASNVTIQCKEGSAILAGADGISLITVTGSDDTVNGCALSANTHTKVNGVWARGANNFAGTQNTFTGAGMIAGYLVNNDAYPAFGARSTGTYLAHNTYIGVFYCTQIWNADRVVAEYETATNVTGNYTYTNILLNSFPNGATVSISHVNGVNMGRMGIEWAGNGIRWVDFSHNTFTFDSTTTATSPTYCISGGTDLFGGATDQLQGGLIDGNSCYNATTAYTGAGYGLEVYGHGYTISNNRIKGHSFVVGLLYDGYGQKIINNIFEGIGASTGYSPYASFGTGENTGGKQNPTHDNLIEGNTCINVQSGCVSAGNGPAPGDSRGDVIRGNYDFRAPGYRDIDSTMIYRPIALGAATGPVLVEGNGSVILPPVNAYVLPGTMVWAAFGAPVAGGLFTYRNNSIVNRNSTAFGQAYYANSFHYMDGGYVAGNKFTNLAYIGHRITGLAASTLQYQDNVSYPGTGAAPASDFTLGSSLGSKLVTRENETGTDDAIAGTFGGAPKPYDGLIVTVQLAHALRAGPNTFDFNGSGPLAIRRATAPITDLTMALSPEPGGSGTIRLMYNAHLSAWLDLSQ